MQPRRLSSLLLCLTYCLPAWAQHGDPEPYAPRVAPASDEAVEAMRRIELPAGFEIQTWAAEPHLANPVALYIDRLGRCFVAETFRLHAGVTDMRSHMNWLHDELAARTVQDRLDFMQKHEGDNYDAYSTEHERVRLVLDTDGDGRADLSTVYADGFSDPAAGIAAGLLARGDELYYACIPNLWLLADRDGDGVAEERRALHTGYGVKIALLGHDLHGLRLGPDGRLYFSVGDRGLNIEFEGRRIELPDRGSVLRCELDGSGLEVYATGLRNPQELAFDDQGNLFTGDNNSDGGDKARWVYILRGSDAGWRHHYQYVTQPNLRGPWNAEKGWHPYHLEQPAFIVPPIDNFINGPSGLCAYPGVGWGDAWRGTFFLCEFRGAASHSGVFSLRNEPKGAGFALVDDARFAWQCLPTDCDFGPDGALYVSDWVNGWGMTGKGRIWRIAPEGLADDAAASAAAELLAAGMTERRTAALKELLGHAHREVRLEAQLEIAERAIAAPAGTSALRANLGALVESALSGAGLARLHGIWGIGVVARRHPGGLTGFDEPLLALLEDSDLEVRCQALRALGELGSVTEPALRGVRYSLARAFEDRERYFAAEAIGALGDASDVPRLVELLAYNDDRDPWLRHGLIFALERLDARYALIELARAHESVAVRRALAVVLRRWRDPALSSLLDDVHPQVVAESARAIHHVPLIEQTGALAERLDGDLFGDWYLGRRALNANRHQHDAPALERITRLLQRPGLDPRLALEALEILAEWGDPSPVDRIHGAWRPVPAGDPEPLLELLPGVLASAAPSGWEPGSWRAFVRLVRGLAPPAAHPALARLETLVRDVELDGQVRRDAFEALVALAHPAREELLALALADSDGRLRAAGLQELGREDPDTAVALLSEAIVGGTHAARQAAVSALGEVPGPLAGATLARLAGEVAGSQGNSPIGVELIEAAEQRGAPAALEAVAELRPAASEQEPLGPWLTALVGGDAEAGRKVFLEKAEVNCLRCHVVGADGTSEVGPDLTDVGERLDRRGLLDSIARPNATLAEEYQSWVFALTDGTLLVGRIVMESPEGIDVLDAEGVLHELTPDEIEGRKRDVSAMPMDLIEQLSLRELRDVVEFLAGQRGQPSESR